MQPLLVPSPLGTAGLLLVPVGCACLSLSMLCFAVFVAVPVSQMGEYSLTAQSGAVGCVRVPPPLHSNQ